jgi:cardiolipin synthase
MGKTAPPSPLNALPPGKARWEKEKIYFKGGDYYRDLLSALQRAKKSVDFEVYIFEKGILGDRVVAALLQAARRGVKVRVLVDGIGSPDFASHYGPQLTEGGVPFRVYRSWHWFISSSFHAIRLWSLFASLRKVGEFWTWGKHRDHRKFCVVDGKKVWMGSFNVSDWHLEKIKGGKVWRDTGIFLSGLKSLVFGLAFQLAWEDKFGSRTRNEYRGLLSRWLSMEVQGGPIWITGTHKLRRLYRRELFKRFQAARKRIWVIAPYFVPTGVLLRALAGAARGGREVVLILPGHSDVPMVRWVSMAYYPYLLRAGCRIFEYQKGILHAKTLLVDGWSLVGSSNLDQRSLRKDLEINVVPRDPETLRALERQFKLDLRQSGEVTLADMKRKSVLARVLSWMFFRFRYWF